MSLATPSSRPTRNETCMGVAQLIRLRGTCSRMQVGVAIAREGRILSTGYNSAPAGMDHCNHDCTCDVSSSLMGLGIHADWCPANPDRVCEVTIHAEINAICWAARHGISLMGADLFTTYLFCLNCAKAVINAGIVCVYYAEEYHDKRGMELVVEAGLSLIDLPYEL
jgi:dCMP deaminase